MGEEIRVNNLDLGYEQCKTLNTTVQTEGNVLLTNLASNINSLKGNWLSADGTAHINNLISVYNGLSTLLSNAMIVTSSAAKKIIAVQMVRNANGGGGMIGDNLNTTIEVASIAPAEMTAQYSVDKSLLNSDLVTLRNIYSDYQKFLNDFEIQKEDLLSNWLAGANREQAIMSFETFKENTSKYATYFDNAISDLATACGNISQL